jgi:hypothetical protein
MTSKGWNPPMNRPMTKPTRCYVEGRKCAECGFIIQLGGWNAQTMIGWTHIGCLYVEPAG